MNRYRDSFSHEETENLLNALLDLLWDKVDKDSIRTDGDILWHFTINEKPLGSFRDDNGDRWDVNRPYMHCSIEAGINPNGVGDKQLPEVAMTYSINCSWGAYVTPYRCKNGYNKDYKKFYGYSRYMEDVVNRFADFLEREGL